MLRFVSIGRISEPLLKSRRHSHCFWELSLYTGGEGVALIGDERVAFRPGTIICYPPHIPHEEHSPQGCLEYYIHTEGSAVFAGGIPVFEDAPDGAFARLTTQLSHEFQLRERGWEQITQRLFQLLMDYLDRWHGADHHPLVVELKHLIMLGISNPDFDLPAAMESLPMSTDHLRRCFVRITGLTPSAYLTNVRIEEAKRLLKIAGLGVKQTSWQVGFRDPGYFSRLFRKQTGLSPGEYADSPPEISPADIRTNITYV